MRKLLTLGIFTIIATAYANFVSATNDFSFVDWTEGNTTDLLDIIKGVIADLSPLLIIIVGIGIGLIVVGAIISAIRGHN